MKGFYRFAESVDGFLVFDSLLFGHFYVETADDSAATEDCREAGEDVVDVVVGRNRENAAFVV